MANLPSEHGAPKRDDRAARPQSMAPVEDDRSAHADVAFDDLPRQLGRYLLLKRIARGGMGEVLLASTTGIEGAERPVIVKIIRREHKKDPNFYARFLDETRVQAQLSHSGVAQVIDAALDDRTGEPYAVVEHVEGKSLGELRQRAVQTGHRIAWADAVALAQLVAEGLSYVHERRDAKGAPLAIVHRDLSPQNVMVSFTGEVKIIDFGTARGQNRRCHTVAGVVFAKPGYVAPEVANGDSGDARVDLYALGVMLWELCAGRRFLQGDAQAHLAKVARNEMNLPKIAGQVGAPEGLDAVIAKLTCFDRDARYLAARAAATDLAKLLGAAPALSSGERGVRPRAAHLMHALFPGEPLASRKEFARLVAAARAPKAAVAAVSAAPAQAAAPASKNGAPAAPGAKPASARPAAAPAEALPSLAGSAYRAIREIGRGASSVVLEAEHGETKKRAAVKILTGEAAVRPEIAERFRRAARALSLLDHEHLVHVHDVGVLQDGRPFCAMELHEGETLRDYLAREKGADYREALGIASKILAALEVAHSAGIVHRDIQPANVLLTSDGGLRVVDFGLAGGRAIALDKAANGPAGDVVLHGTPEYVAPEQATGGDVDGRADLYSVGCVLFEMLTSRLPFEGPSAVAIVDQKRKGSPPRPAEIAPSRGIPEAVSELVMKALARQPSARFQSATEMRKAIDAALSRSRGRRSRRVLGALAAVTAMLAVAFGAGLVRSETLRSKMPAQVAALFAKEAPITAELANPGSDAAPARTTDLVNVPLGEVAVHALHADDDADPTAVHGPPLPPAPSGELAALDDGDPALGDPAENEDVHANGDMLAAQPITSNAGEGDGEANDDPTATAKLEEPAASAEPAKPAPKPAKKHRSKPATKKASTPKLPKPSDASNKPAKPESAPSTHKPEGGSSAHPAKNMALPKDDGDAGRKKKKKKVRLAKAK